MRYCGSKSWSVWRIMSMFLHITVIIHSYIQFLEDDSARQPLQTPAFLQGLMRPPWSVRCLKSHQVGSLQATSALNLQKCRKTSRRADVKSLYTAKVPNTGECAIRIVATPIFRRDFTLRTAKAFCQWQLKISPPQRRARSLWALALNVISQIFRLPTQNCLFWFLFDETLSDFVSKQGVDNCLFYACKQPHNRKGHSFCFALAWLHTRNPLTSNPEVQHKPCSVEVAVHAGKLKLVLLA